ncbi:MAG TPA: CocE/NonD family hydrolase, partial [Thermoleophilaceae bacterium]|nr:CocE/NonD family hydrolase [Thermoleophilaceae bacterium]
ACLAPAAHARDATVNSFDGTPIITHFFPADGLGPGERAPTIMVGHGWGGSGEEDPDSGSVGLYTSHGYNVLTWDARGFGQSGGTVMIDSPDFEAKDAIALIDFVARQPEAQLDGSRDPRLGMDGPSYGGGIQFLTAALDDRVDAITPTIAWHTLPRSLYQRRVIKLGWDLALVGLGIPTSVAEGVFSPAGVQTGHQSPEFYDAVVSGSSTGSFPPDIVDFFKHRGPDYLLDRIEAPTLIVQGTVDTLFTLEEAHRNFRALERQGVPLKMMWYCGGHGVCLTERAGVGLTGSGGLVEDRKLAWFRRYLKDRADVATGPKFEWLDERGRWHRERGYPPEVGYRVRGQGSGDLALPPGTLPPPVGSGALVFPARAVPSPAALTVPIEKPPAGSEVIGVPRLKIAYRGQGVPVAGNRFEAFAQIVDRRRNIVVNNLASPIPLELDGKRHEASLPLERIASVSTSEGYELQLVASTSVYDVQRGTGNVSFQSIEVSLPVSGERPDDGEGGSGDGGRGGGGDEGGGRGDTGPE